MTIVTSGRLGLLIVFALYIAIAYYFTTLGRKGKLYPLRKIAAIDVIKDAVGRAAEMGRSFYFDCSTAGLTGTPQATMAMFSVLDYVLDLAVQTDAPLVIGIKGEQSEPLVVDMARTKYIQGGKPEMFSDKLFFYLPYASGVIASLERNWYDRNPPAAALYMSGAGEMIHLFEKGMNLGVFQIGAGGDQEYRAAQQICSCDYALIFEEVYAVGAYLSKDPIQVCSIAGLDLQRYVLITLVVIGVLLSFAGSTMLSAFLTM